MRKIIIWGIICLFILGCSNRKRAIIELTNYHIEFGKISQGEFVDTCVTLYNRGNETLIIRRIATDCNCTNASIDKSKLMPNDSAKIHISLDTSEKQGEAEDLVIFEANTDSLIHFISVHAEVICKQIKE